MIFQLLFKLKDLELMLRNRYPDEVYNGKPGGKIISDKTNKLFEEFRKSLMNDLEPVDNE